MTAFDKFEKFTKPIYNGQDFLKKHIFGNYPIEYVDDTNNFDVLKKYQDVEYVWLVDQSIKVFESFPWHFKPINEEPKIHAFPYVFKKGRHVKSWDKVKLVPTKQGTYETKQHIHICGEYDVYKGKNRFDIFYIGNDKTVFDNLENRNLNIQFVDSFETAQLCSYTDMFWLIYDDTEIRNTFKFSYEPDEWSFDFVHVFGNGDIDRLDGVALFPKDYTPTEKELSHRFFVKKKEIRILASNPRKYDKFIINNFYDYEQAMSKSTTEMFWGIPGDISVLDESVFEFTISHQDADKKQNHVWLNENKYDGIVLFSKHSPVSKKEIDYRFIIDRIEHETIVSRNKPFDKFIINSYEDYCDALQKSSTSMFWGIPSDISLNDDFEFDNFFSKQETLDRTTVHVFLNGVNYDGIALFNKIERIAQKEIEHRFYTNKKEWNIIASEPKPFDYFEIDSYDEFMNAMNVSKTDMFWMSSKNIKADLDFCNSFYISHHDSYNRKENHVFVHQVDDKKLYNGLFLCSKINPITKQEVEHRFIVNRKEWDIVASGKINYPIYEIDTYDEYLAAIDNSQTEMFWMSSKNIEANVPDIYFSHDNDYDRKTNHVFIHKVENKNYKNGLFLCTKHQHLTKNEVEYRHIINAKEWEIVGSREKKYDKFTINSYNDYIDALKNTKTEMFWGIPDDVTVAENFDFSIYFSHDNEYDRNITHVFLNDTHRDGIVLFSKNHPVSEKEIEHRFFIKKKEWNVIASYPKTYDKFEIHNYDDYANAKKLAKTELFWITYPDLILEPNFNWNFYINHHNQYERKINHVWKNGEFFDGVALVSKHLDISKKEIEHRFFAIKKEYDVLASKPKPFDIVFISNNEPDADTNYNLLINRFPHAKRINGIKGIHNAHRAAAESASTEMFWVVDGDAQILDDFDFDYQISYYDLDGRSTVYVWRSLNPVNGLVYGYGGVKLLPKFLTLNMDVNSTDMTTSISNKFRSINRMSNITAFNTDDFSAWRSGFRECAKLSSKIIARQRDDETEFRLNAWCSKGEDKPFGKAAIHGAQQGRLFGEINKNNTDEMKKINDFEWLYNQFKQLYQST